MNWQQVKPATNKTCNSEGFAPKKQTRSEQNIKQKCSNNGITYNNKNESMVQINQ